MPAARAGSTKKPNSACVVAMPEPHTAAKPNGSSPDAGSSSAGRAPTTRPSTSLTPIPSTPLPKQVAATISDTMFVMA